MVVGEWWHCKYNNKLELTWTWAWLINKLKCQIYNTNWIWYKKILLCNKMVYTPQCPQCTRWEKSGVWEIEKMQKVFDNILNFYFLNFTYNYNHYQEELLIDMLYLVILMIVFFLKYVKLTLKITTIAGGAFITWEVWRYISSVSNDDIYKCLQRLGFPQNIFWCWLFLCTIKI